MMGNRVRRIVEGELIFQAPGEYAESKEGECERKGAQRRTLESK